MMFIHTCTKKDALNAGVWYFYRRKISSKSVTRFTKCDPAIDIN